MTIRINGSGWISADHQIEEADQVFLPLGASFFGFWLSEPSVFELKTSRVNRHFRNDNQAAFDFSDNLI